METITVDGEKILVSETIQKSTEYTYDQLIELENNALAQIEMHTEGLTAQTSRLNKIRGMQTIAENAGIVDPDNEETE